MCQRCKLDYYNVNTGETFSHGCNSYSCPECGPKRIFRLKEALKKEFITWSNLCFWTFTINARWFSNPEQHYKCLTECFSRLITYLRRDPKVTNHNFKYIRFNEIHFGVANPNSTKINTGYVHLHACIDNYISIFVVMRLWKDIVNNWCSENIFYNDPDKTSGCYVKHIKTGKHAANYVIKYVSKTVKQLKFNNPWKRFYSKSFSVVLFRNDKSKNPPDSFVVLFRAGSTSRVLIGLKHIIATPQTFSNFGDVFGLSPPEMYQLLHRSCILSSSYIFSLMQYKIKLQNTRSPIISGFEDFYLRSLGDSRC